jgi:ubiquinone/menaquinone biosynthesis C-methylase UbiE
MIKYANAQAAVQGLDNATFHVMDMQQPLDFLDQSFDLASARSINFLPVDAWPRLVGEMARVTRPNGIVRLTESEWWYFTNSPALERLNAIIIRSIKAHGSYSESGLFTGILPMLGRLLMDAGCEDIRSIPLHSSRQTNTFFLACVFFPRVRGHPEHHPL